MLFKEIKLVNFRQFKGENVIKFATDNSITLIIADNGVGKTTFLQAFRYCFYGESKNYLKLPNSEELLNNQIVNELKELDTATLSVTVEFSHNGVSYIAKRQKEYEKRNNVMRWMGKDVFSLWESTKNSGFRPLTDNNASDLIRRILPPGLAHVYMFDGERMEKRVESKEYQDDLKDAITGILGLKKLDNAISILGNKSQSKKVAGLIYSMQTATTEVEKNTLEEYAKIVNALEILDDKIKKENEILVEKLAAKERFKKYQEDLAIHQTHLQRRDRLKLEIDNDEMNINHIAENNFSILVSAVSNKLLLLTRNDFKSFIGKKVSGETFYQNLHEDTLNDIIARQKCICGTKVVPGSKEYLAVKSHEHNVLPYDNAHHLNAISNEYSISVDLEEQLKKLTSVKEETVRLKKGLREKEIEHQNLLLEIEKEEQRLGRGDIQRQLNTLNDIIHSHEKIRVQYERDRKYVSRDLEKKQKEVDEISKSSEFNRKVETVVDSLDRISRSIKYDLKMAEDDARLSLETNMNKAFQEILVGNFSVKINQQFEIEITQQLEYSSNLGILQKRFQKHTNILSTGQSVMVSLSFINSLLETLNHFRKNTENKHGIIMDAALSNVDEKHIVRVCDAVLNKFDQLVFLSFKRQLRNEFYFGIGKNIGKAYLLSKRPDGGIDIIDKSINQLEDFIHEIEGRRN